MYRETSESRARKSKDKLVRRIQVARQAITVSIIASTKWMEVQIDVLLSQSQAESICCSVRSSFHHNSQLLLPSAVVGALNVSAAIGAIQQHWSIRRFLGIGWGTDGRPVVGFWAGFWSIWQSCCAVLHRLYYYYFIWLAACLQGTKSVCHSPNDQQMHKLWITSKSRWWWWCCCGKEEQRRMWTAFLQHEFGDGPHLHGLCNFWSLSSVQFIDWLKRTENERSWERTRGRRGSLDNFASIDSFRGSSFYSSRRLVVIFFWLLLVDEMNAKVFHRNKVEKTRGGLQWNESFCSAERRGSEKVAEEDQFSELLSIIFIIIKLNSLRPLPHSSSLWMIVHHHHLHRVIGKLKMNVHISGSTHWIMGSTTFGHFFVSDKSNKPLTERSKIIDKRCFWGRQWKEAVCFPVSTAVDVAQAVHCWTVIHRRVIEVAIVLHPLLFGYTPQRSATSGGAAGLTLTVDLMIVCKKVGNDN